MQRVATLKEMLASLHFETAPSKITQVDLFQNDKRKYFWVIAKMSFRHETYISAKCHYSRRHTETRSAWRQRVCSVAGSDNFRTKLSGSWHQRAPVRTSFAMWSIALNKKLSRQWVEQIRVRITWLAMNPTKSKLQQLTGSWYYQWVLYVPVNTRQLHVGIPADSTTFFSSYFQSPTATGMTSLIETKQHFHSDTEKQADVISTHEEVKERKFNQRAAQKKRL